MFGARPAVLCARRRPLPVSRKRSGAGSLAVAGDEGRGAWAPEGTRPPCRRPSAAAGPSGERPRRSARAADHASPWPACAGQSIVPLSLWPALWPAQSLARSVSGPLSLWPAQSLARSVSGPLSLCPAQSVFVCGPLSLCPAQSFLSLARSVSGLLSLWPAQSLARSVSGPLSLWPAQSPARSVSVPLRLFCLWPAQSPAR